MQEVIFGVACVCFWLVAERLSTRHLDWGATAHGDAVGHSAPPEASLPLTSTLKLATSALPGADSCDARARSDAYLRAAMDDPGGISLRRGHPPFCC